jgi:hypothetical protein
MKFKGNYILKKRQTDFYLVFDIFENVSQSNGSQWAAEHLSR